jgi:hypothetical protein
MRAPLVIILIVAVTVIAVAGGVEFGSRDFYFEGREGSA